LLDLPAQLASDGIELRRGELLDIAGGEFGLNFVEVLSERVDPVRDGGKPLIGQGFQFDRAEVLDLELVFAAPVNKGGLGENGA
jgi:hypothetical protein